MDQSRGKFWFRQLFVDMSVASPLYHRHHQPYIAQNPCCILTIASVAGADDFVASFMGRIGDVVSLFSGACDRFYDLIGDFIESVAIAIEKDGLPVRG